MAQYVCLDASDVTSLTRRFGIDDVAAFSRMDGGLENTSYCVETSSGKYVLTIWDQKSLQHATSLANLLVHLTNQGIRTTEVIVPTNEPIVILHDKKPAMLKRYVDGDVTAHLTGNLLVQLGEEMARLHRIPAPPYLPESFGYGRDCFTDVTHSNLGHPYLDWLTERSGELQKSIPAHLPKALIHGDVFFDNVIVQGEQLMAIIDFEEACRYYRGFDLGMAIVGTCRDRKGISFEKAEQFLRGYQKETTLELIERETLKAFTVYAAVATSFWRFRQYHLRRPEPQFHDKHLEMQTLADTISEHPDSRFMELFVRTGSQQQPNRLEDST
jgi:homoserine kinase type II